MSQLIHVAEIAFIDGGQVPIAHKHADRMVVLRNADDPDGDALYYTPNEWEAFILGAKDGEFDDMIVESHTPSARTPHTQDAPSPPWVGRPAISIGEKIDT